MTGPGKYVFRLDEVVDLTALIDADIGRKCSPPCDYTFTLDPTLLPPDDPLRTQPMATPAIAQGTPAAAPPKSSYVELEFKTTNAIKKTASGSQVAAQAAPTAYADIDYDRTALLASVNGCVSCMLRNFHASLTSHRYTNINKDDLAKLLDEQLHVTNSYVNADVIKREEMMGAPGKYVNFSAKELLEQGTSVVYARTARLLSACVQR